jgi:hypothetical protein
MSRIARKPGERTGIEEISHMSPDISEWLDFGFYDLVWYWDYPKADDNPCLGRWLGVAHRVGSDMCYWVLTRNGEVLARTTVQHVPDIDKRVDEMRRKIDDFNKDVLAHVGTNPSKQIVDTATGTEDNHMFSHDIELERHNVDPGDSAFLEVAAQRLEEDDYTDETVRTPCHSHSHSHKDDYTSVQDSSELRKLHGKGRINNSLVLSKGLRNKQYRCWKYQRV